MAFITLQIWTYSERIISDEAGVDWLVDAILMLWASQIIR